MDPEHKVEEEYTQDNQPVIVDDDSDDAHDDASNGGVEPVPADDEESTGKQVHKLKNTGVEPLSQPILEDAGMAHVPEEETDDVVGTMDNQYCVRSGRYDL
ncbi:hypothetical protein ACA910_006917 [Epithemia clementina (nom. ined.)]